ncbi:MAG: hypothetical protein ACRDHP_04485 [Ktedonobacterales bacterium]
MSVSQSQCFLIALVLTGAIGARRGWGREVITCAIILGTVLFLLNGGGNVLAGWLTQATSSASSATTGNSAPLCSLNGQMLSTLAFAGMSWLGYSAGTKWGNPPKTGNHRIAGTIPGAMNGAAMAYYVSNSILPGRQVLVNSPSPAFAGAELPVIIGIALIGLLAVLFVAAQTSKK